MKVGRLGRGDADGGGARGRGDKEIRLRSSARVYGGKWMCGIPGLWKRWGRGKVIMKTVARLGIWVRCQLADFGAEVWLRHTSSPKRARAGRRVGAASRWRSILSKTRMNFFWSSNSRCSCTTKALILSHRPSTGGALSSPRASWTSVRVRSRRCRVVMHSFDRMMALGVSIAESNALMVRLLPVASVPWRTRFGRLKRSDCRVREQWI